MNMGLAINQTELRVLQYVIDMFDKPDVYSPRTIEEIVREYHGKIKRETEEMEKRQSTVDSVVSRVKAQSALFADLYCDRNGVTISDADPGL